MAGKIRVGLVGATVTPGGSGWGANAHIPALRSLPEYEIRAVCTAHHDTAEASREAFGAEMAFHDFDAMIARPDIDLVTVVVRVPRHCELVMKALQAGKQVYCEWPLGASVEEAERMAQLAAERSLRTAVGLQARSDPGLAYARELVRQGYVGQLLSVHFTSIAQAVTERGEGRIWQGDRRNGANTLTIAAGHAIDAVTFVTGELRQVTALLATQLTEWHNPETGATMHVDAPDWISVAGQLEQGAELSFLVSTVPTSPSGTRMEIYGREGTLVITTAGSINMGTTLAGAHGSEALAPIEVPERFTQVPAATPPRSPRNVAQAYARFARAVEANQPFEPDFAHAVKRHKLIAAIEQSAAGGRTVALEG
jgi:predicted dehydrogenase